MAFLEGMEIGIFLLLPGRVSHAAACDGNLYTIDASRQNALSGTLPLEWNFQTASNSLGTFTYGIYNILHVNIVNV